MPDARADGTRRKRPPLDPSLRAEVKAAIALYMAGDVQAAFDQALPLAEEGDHEAQRLIGNVLQQRGSIAAARDWWRRAAEAGDPPAQFNLGLSYQDDSGGAVDPLEAEAWLSEAAQGGHAQAMLQLGELLLRTAGDDETRAGAGLAWLRVAAESAPEQAARVLTGALKVSHWSDAAHFARLQQAATKCLAPSRGTIGPSLLGQIDREESGAGGATRFLCERAGMQNLKRSAYADHPSRPSPATLPMLARSASEELAGRKTPPGRETSMVWALCRSGTTYDVLETIPLPATRLWDLVRPGDYVALTDGINAHVTMVWSVDRETGTIRFIDWWPDEFLLLPGLNVLGIEATVEPLGRTRHLIAVGRDDFIASASGVLSQVGIASIEKLWASVPELRDDANAVLALACTLAGAADHDACARGLGWLMALLRVEQLPVGRAAAVADRAWVAAERLACEAPGRRITCAALGTSGPIASPQQLLDELRSTWPPSFTTLSPRVLHDLAARRHEQPVDTGWRSWTRRLAGRAVSQPLYQTDARGAAALLQHALRQYPENERLRLAQATLELERGRTEAAIGELTSLIATLDAKRQQIDPLVVDLDGMEGGIGSQRESFAEAQVSALTLRAGALMRRQRAHDATLDVQAALRLRNGEDLGLLRLLKQAAIDAGDAALVADTESRLGALEPRRLIEDLVSGRLPIPR